MPNLVFCFESVLIWSVVNKGVLCTRVATISIPLNVYRIFGSQIFFTVFLAWNHAFYWVSLGTSVADLTRDFEQTRDSNNLWRARVATLGPLLYLLAPSLFRVIHGIHDIWRAKTFSTIYKYTPPLLFRTLFKGTALLQHKKRILWNFGCRPEHP